MDNKIKNRRTIIVASAIGLTALGIGIPVSVMTGNTTPSPNVGSATELQSAVNTWDNQASVTSAVQHLIYPAETLNSASVEVTSDVNGYEVTLWWQNGYWMQYQDNTSPNSLSAVMGYVPNGDGTMTMPPTTLSQNATIDNQGIISLNG